MEDAKWYFTHETEEDRLWYRIFFAMCRKFGVSWPKASEEQKAFIEEITRINYEREMAKRNMTAKPVRGFFDAETSALTHTVTHTTKRVDGHSGEDRTYLPQYTERKASKSLKRQQAECPDTLRNQ